MPTEDVRGGKTPLPRRVERKLLVRRVPPEMFAETRLLERGGTDIDLRDYTEENYPAGLPATHWLPGGPANFPEGVDSMQRTGVEGLAAERVAS